jgi:ligand-binding sensor domain-containing protein
MKLFLIIFLFVCTLSVSAQGPQWIVYNTGNSGLPGNSIRTIGVDSNNIVWIGTGYGLVKYYNNNWTVFDTSNSGIANSSVWCLEIDNDNNIWVGAGGGLPGGVSKFDGSSWVNFNPGNSSIPSANVIDLDFDSQGNLWVATLNGLGKFDGSNWTVFRDTNSGLPTNSLTNVEANGDTIWIGTQNSGVVKYDGQNWVTYNTQNSGLPYNTIFLRDAIKFDSNNIVWIGTYGGGLAKFDGLNWTVFNHLNSPLPSSYVTSLLIKENIIGIGTGNKGIAFLKNNNKWEIFNDSNSVLPSNTVNTIASDKLGNTWIGTNNGVAIYNETGIVNIKNIYQLQAQDFELLQNYPNPFNPTTKIKFAIPKSGNVRLKVFDQLGREVRTLVNGELTAGSYEYEFDGSGLASGVYFYRIETGSFVETKKMLLIK